MFKKINICHDEMMKKVTVTGDKLTVEVINMSKELGNKDMVVLANNGFRQNWVWGPHSIEDEQVKYLSRFAFVIFDEIQDQEYKIKEQQETVTELTE